MILKLKVFFRGASKAAQMALAKSCKRRVRIGPKVHIVASLHSDARTVYPGENSDTQQALDEAQRS